VAELIVTFNQSTSFYTASPHCIYQCPAVF